MWSSRHSSITDPRGYAIHGNMVMDGTISLQKPNKNTDRLEDENRTVVRSCPLVVGRLRSRATWLSSQE